MTDSIQSEAERALLVEVMHDDGEHEPFVSYAIGIFATKEIAARHIANLFDNNPDFEARAYGDEGTTWNLVHRATGEESDLVIVMRSIEIYGYMPAAPIQVSEAVIQPDRDAASKIVRCGAPGVGNGNKVIAAEIKGGLHDDYLIVQEFRRHRLEAIASTPVQVSEAGPVLWLHTMHMEGGRTYFRLLDHDGLDENEPERTAFGIPGRDYSAEYLVTSEPIFRSTTVQVSEADVERVARAICNSAGDDPDIASTNAYTLRTRGANAVMWEEWIPEARAAIAAMPRDQA